MTRRNEFASTWWAQRWIRLLEKFGWSARLNRGRSYARHGNVLDIDVQPGLVRARVQGSRKQPYRVEIGLKPISKQDWNKVISLLRRKAIYAARLLSGEMPRDIEEIFKAAGVPLFPQSGQDLIMSCTCPDWASPCKHVAAVYYVLGSEFDRDPFLLFQLRGRSRDQVMASLRGQRPERAPRATVPRVGSEPLEAHLSDFWEAGEEMDEITIRVTPPPVPGAILKRLGQVPLVDLPEEWNGDLSRMYEVVSRDALAFVHASGKVPRAPIAEPELLNGSNGAQPDEIEETASASPELTDAEDDLSASQDESEAEENLSVAAAEPDTDYATASIAEQPNTDGESLPAAAEAESLEDAPAIPEQPRATTRRRRPSSRSTQSRSRQPIADSSEPDPQESS